MRQRVRKGVAHCHFVDLLQLQPNSVQENASPAAALDDVHRQVRAHQQRVDSRGRVQGVDSRQADAGQHRHHPIVHLEGRAETAEQRPGNLDGLWLVLQQHSKLVSAEPRDGVSIRETLAQARRDLT